MDPWVPVEGRVAAVADDVLAQQQDAFVRGELQRRHAQWTQWASATVLDDLAELLSRRAEQFGWSARFPYRVSPVRALGTNTETLRHITVSLWHCSVDVYVRTTTTAPPAIHFWRQSGGHRAPRMACLPGAWLFRASPCYQLRRFDEEGSPVTLDELGAQVVTLLLGGLSRQ